MTYAASAVTFCEVKCFCSPCISSWCQARRTPSSCQHRTKALPKPCPGRALGHAPDPTQALPRPCAKHCLGHGARRWRTTRETLKRGNKPRHNEHESRQCKPWEKPTERDKPETTKSQSYGPDKPCPRNRQALLTNQARPGWQATCPEALPRGFAQTPHCAAACPWV